MLLVHRRNVIQPVEIRYGLEIGLIFNQLFSAAMEQTDMRIDAGDNFAVKLEYKTQHAMGRRMLGAEVDVKFRTEASVMTSLSRRRGGLVVPSHGDR